MRKEILEIYPAIQSEGSRAGLPTVVVRVSGCTHRCYFREGGWCDTPYTSINPEKNLYGAEDVVKVYDKYLHIKEMMITGGSPTLYPDLLEKLTRLARERNIITTLETEGSHFVQTSYPIDLVSLSPKFSNSVPVLHTYRPDGRLVDPALIKTHNKYRLNKKAIRQMIDYHKDYHFKPVINPTREPEVWEEIKDFMRDLNIPKEKTWIMAPGNTDELLKGNYAEVIEFCWKEGYNFSSRIHINTYGSKRYV